MDDNEPRLLFTLAGCASGALWGMIVGVCLSGSESPSAALGSAMVGLAVLGSVGLFIDSRS